MIYAAALLHDIVRAEQYRNGTPHDVAGCAAAEPILAECGFAEEERDMILTAIGSHRKKKSRVSGGAENRAGEAEQIAEGSGTQKKAMSKEALAAILYHADKKSRLCFLCNAEAECNWAKEKKNTTLEYSLNLRAGLTGTITLTLTEQNDGRKRDEDWKQRI